MEFKHGHVKQNGDNDEAQGSGQKVSRPGARLDAQIPEEQPELEDSAHANGGDSEETDPLAGQDCAERKTGQGEPGPPLFGKRFLLVFVPKPDEQKGGECGEKDQWGIEEDVTRLSDEAVFED